MPYLERSGLGQVITLSPPLDPNPRWFASHAPYTVTKYGMTMLTLGVAEQYRARGVAAYCLWPQTLIATAAVKNIVGGEEGMRAARTPEIVADAAHALLISDLSETTGRCHIDAEVLHAAGVDDLSSYAAVAGTPDAALVRDLFV
jgi:citronellol/citronellal dehydrogenase